MTDFRVGCANHADFAKSRATTGARVGLARIYESDQISCKVARRELDVGLREDFMPRDVAKAAVYATQNVDAANRFGHGQCAKYVEIALRDGGGFPMLHVGGTGDAKDFGPALMTAGFLPLQPPGAALKVGDIVVMDGTSKSTAGHTAIYNGTNWVSDFVQDQIYPGPTYRKEKPSYVVYRYFGQYGEAKNN
jgi:hypothetical protein